MDQRKNIVNHIINDTFAENFCFVCLSQLEEFHEHIFTKICKEGVEYCVADVLKSVFNLQIKDCDNYNICPDCFIGALSVYKFHLQLQRSQEILSYYLESVATQAESILEGDAEINDPNMACIMLHDYVPTVPEFNIDLGSFANNYVKDEIVKEDESEKEFQDDDIILIKNEEEESLFYQIDKSGNFVEISNKDALKCSWRVDVSNEDVVPKKRKPYVKKIQDRKKRSLMEYITCTKCPIKYRFVSKMREHMKTDHDLDIFICKICKEVIYNEQEYYLHLMSHLNTFVCATCGEAFKKRKTMIAHIKKHDAAKNIGQKLGAHVCEVCGEFLSDEEKLREHNEVKHVKKYICFYCGKTYKTALSLDMHIRKHEKCNSSLFKCDTCDESFDTKPLLDLHIDKMHVKDFFCNKCKEAFASKEELKKHCRIHKDFYCEKCNRSFVDARALMWHQRLHNNERPYICQTCGRGFVSANRRNQHCVCAHTAPTRRCPVCPALFHLRSMVNTHIRKVHLQEHRRRNKASTRNGRNRDVFWRTEVVPLQELSVDIQSSLLDLQTTRNDSKEDTI